MERKQKNTWTNQKGITLIALVITIVVLLILAGVSLNAIIGDNGIVKRAQEASQKSDTTGIREKIDMELWGIYAEKGDYTNADVITAVKKVIEADTGEEIEVEVKQETVTTAKGNEVYIFDLWKDETTLLEMYLAGESCTVENCTDENHLHIGDYVDYQPSNTNSATNYVEVGQSKTGYSSTQKYQYDAITQWRVLGLTEDRAQVKLISANPISKALDTWTDGTTSTDDVYLELSGAESYVYCESTLDKICSIYSNSSLGATAKSIRMEDINLALGVTVTRNENGVPTVTYNGSSIDEYGWLESYTYQEGDYTPEGYLNGETATTEEVVYRTSYWYYMDNFADSTVKSIIFDGTSDNKWYWVASPGVNADTTYASFGPGDVYYGYADCGYYNLFDSLGDANSYWCAVRPVVSLGSNVTVTQVPKTTAKEDTTWDVQEEEDN